MFKDYYEKEMQEWNFLAIADFIALSLSLSIAFLVG